MPSFAPRTVLFCLGLSLGSLSVSGCGADAYADLSGTVAGETLKPEGYFWGGPFLIFTSKAYECIDMYWVKRGPTFETGVEPPVEDDIVALLFTFEDSDVTEGNVSLEGDAPVDGRLLVIQDGAMTVYRAETGSLTIDEFTKKDAAVGSFDVGFDDGSMSGDFEVDWCTNMKTKD